MNDGEILGLEDFDFGLLLTRFMVVSKSDFERVGGFDETLTDLEDTDFRLRAKKAVLSITAVPRDSISHFDYPVRIGNWKRRVFYVRMFSRRGLGFLPLFLRMARKKIQS